jgi:CubicO group peptidase (beta-lactamase class C family)
MTIADRLDAAVGAYPGRGGLCGAMRISRDGEVLMERAYGYASVQLGVANRPETRFHIASMTKMFTAAAIVRLVGEGRLDLRAHPSAYRPDLAAIDSRISLHHLLTHTSGLADIYDQPDLRIDMAVRAKQGGQPLDYLTGLPQLFEPGDRWAYSTTGFLLLAYVLEAICHRSFAEAIGALFLKPLDLGDTGSDDPYRVNPGRASGQNCKDGVWRNTGLDELAEVEMPREFYSTVGDIDRWASHLLNGEVLDEGGMALSFTPYAQVGTWGGLDPNLGYGYGWFLGPDHRWIGGMTAGFRATLWQFPAERLNVVMLWNNEAVDSQSLFATLRPILPR